MAQFIGSIISLVSKSDIRYIGKLEGTFLVLQVVSRLRAVKPGDPCKEDIGADITSTILTAINPEEATVSLSDGEYPICINSYCHIC
jgi:hypothetical protein